MRVLHLTNHCRNSGNGIVNVAVDLACCQASGGCAVAFASGGGEFQELMASHGVRHWHVEQRRRSPMGVLRALRQLIRCLGETRPDIVHAHMMTGAVLAFLLRPFWSYRLVTTVHNEFQRSSALMRVGDRIVAVSEAVKTALLSRGFDARKIRIVKNGPIGSPRRSAATAPSPGLRRPAVVTVAGLNPRKGIPDLIAAFENIAASQSAACLYIVGDGPEREACEARARRSPAAERIIFCGFQPDPSRYVEECDVFALASREEPFGLVLAEARALGRAIVATRVGGIPEVLDGGRCGVLVEPGDIDALGQALSALLDNEEQRRELERQAPIGIELFSVDHMATGVMRVYQEIVRARRAERAWIAS